VFVGFGTGASFVSAARYLAQAMPASELAMAQGYYGGSVLLGSGFVIFAVPRVAQAWGWPVGFLSTAAVATGVLLLWVVAAPEPERRPHPASSLLALLGHRQLWLLGLVQMASFGLVIVVASWLTMLLRTRLDLTVPAAGAVGSIVLLLGILTRPLGGRLVGHIGVRPVLMTSMVLNAAGCFLLGMRDASFSRAIMAIVLLGTGCGLPYAALFNRAAALFPGRAGAAMGLVNMLGIVMILVGAPLIGRIADWTGSYAASFLSLGIFSLIVCVAATAVDRAVQHPR
jgi:DHA1 family inner membrane transport protein